VIYDFDKAEMTCTACGYVPNPQQVLEIEGISFTAQEVAQRILHRLRNLQVAMQAEHQKIDADARAKHRKLDDDFEAEIKRATDGSPIKLAKTCKRCHNPMVSTRARRGRPPQYHIDCKEKTVREQRNQRQRRWQERHPDSPVEYQKRGKGFARQLIAWEAAHIPDARRNLRRITH